MLGGQGIGLPPPQGLWYPLPTNQAYQPLGSAFMVPDGSGLFIPPGWWLVRTGTYTQIQWLDPVSGTWIPYTATGVSTEVSVNSDGANVRLFNPHSTPTGATVTAQGTGYAQATTIVTPNAGNSQWRAVVGGALASIVVGNNPAGVLGGSNFTIPPIVDIPAPPPGGVQATAHATITAGAVSAVTLDNPGAGYTAAPVPVIRPCPFDPNIGSITVPALTSTLGFVDHVTAVLLVNGGRELTAPEQAAFALTISGAGTGATATATFVTDATGTVDNTVYLQAMGGAF
jgi:hypothetical protein